MRLPAIPSTTPLLLPGTNFHRNQKPRNQPQALGASESQPDGESAAAEARALQEVGRILAPVKDASWPSGRPENSSLPF
jgi:hypothetical protein